MNILVSYQWIKEYLDTDLSAEAFAKQTTNAGNSVERSDRLAERFAHMVVGLVKRVEPHPNADKLRIAKTDIGTDVVEIVCGGENLAEGQRVVVGLPGARVRWHGEGELMELSMTKIRGVESHGMICAVEEIGFEKLATGKKDIWDISSFTNAKPGTPIAVALDLDDVIFDIEVTSNRPDCMSIIGQAREGSAVTQDTFTYHPAHVDGNEEEPFSLNVKEPTLCPMYSAILLEGVTVGPSPWWIQKKLLLAGHRPINNIVDITNLVLHEYGQPLHAFDADQLEGETIIVRKAKKGEHLLALDGNTYTLTPEQLVIADKKHPVALAGVMGGQASGTSEKTTRVLLEAATFDPVSIRRTARALNVYSDSQLLFEKGLSVQAPLPALARAVELIQQIAGGVIASKVMIEQAEAYVPRVLSFDPNHAHRLMGISIKESDMIRMLERLGFEMVAQPGGTYAVTIPYWRDHDIEHSVDFVEEIARVYGYDRFPSILPTGVIPLAQPTPALTWSARVKETLSGMGVNEVYAYSFVSEKQLERSGIALDQAIKIKNPLNEDLGYMRPTLTASMLTVIAENQSRFSQADLFELAPVYHMRVQDIPEQPLRLVLASYGKDGRDAFARAKGVLERVLRSMGIRQVEVERMAETSFWYPARSGMVHVNGRAVGTIGQVSAHMAAVHKLDVDVVLADLDFEWLLSQASLQKSYTPIPTFPPVKRDLAFVLADGIAYGDVEKKIRATSTLLTEIELFDVYRGKGVEQGTRSLAMHFTFQSLDRTLDAKEVDHELEQVRTMLQESFGAILRS